MTTAIIGTGSTISHTGWSGKITNITRDGRSIGKEDASNMDTTSAKEYIAHTLEEPGTITVEAEYVGVDPTFGGAVSNLVVTLSNAVTITVSAFVESENWTIPLEGKCVTSITFALSGDSVFA